MNKVLFSSASEHWSTPNDLYSALDKEFKFTLDPCLLNEPDLCEADCVSEELRRALHSPA
jgi:hypothetical protein